MTKLYIAESPNNKLTFSPFVWRIQMALMHKGVSFEKIGLAVADIKPKITQLTNGKWAKVPTVQYEDGTIIFDSLVIAKELETRYPDADKLFPNGYQHAEFFESYFINFSKPLFHSALPNMLRAFTKSDANYFQKSFEDLYQAPLEQILGDKKQNIKEGNNVFEPFRAALKKARFLEGEKVTYSDYIVFGVLQWIRLSSPADFDFYVNDNEDPTLKLWFESLLDLYDGFARNTLTSRDVGIPDEA